MKNIYLVGFMGTGKSVVARMMARRMKLKFVDLDSLIEKKERRKIKDIFSQNGEFYFRTLEKEAVEQVSGEQSLVVACGGGVMVNDENVENLKKSGIIVCLTSRPEVILERCKGQNKRPLLNVDNPLDIIKELLSFRAKYYAKADLSLDTSDLTVEQVREEISQRLTNHD